MSHKALSMGSTKTATTSLSLASIAPWQSMKRMVRHKSNPIAEGGPSVEAQTNSSKYALRSHHHRGIAAPNSGTAAVIAKKASDGFRSCGTTNLRSAIKPPTRRPSLAIDTHAAPAGTRSRHASVAKGSTHDRQMLKNALLRRGGGQSMRHVVEGAEAVERISGSRKHVPKETSILSHRHSCDKDNYHREKVEVELRTNSTYHKTMMQVLSSSLQDADISTVDGSRNPDGDEEEDYDDEAAEDQQHDEDEVDSSSHNGKQQRGRKRRPKRPLVLKGQRGSYAVGDVVGTGSFGAVFEATCIATGARVAIKRILLDPRYKNRELSIMASLDHPNVVQLRDYYFSEDNPLEGGSSSTKSQAVPGSQVLHLMMDWMPTSLHSVMRGYSRANKFLPIKTIRLFLFQLLKAVKYLHAQGLAHRDIKLPNILVDMKSGRLKLCDFGCAKMLEHGASSIAYICTRFYRAPELVLGEDCYDWSIDLWSVGCVFGELLKGSHLFIGESSADQLIKIAQVLGTPSPAECASNPYCAAIRKAVGGHLDPLPWKEVLPVDRRVPASAIDLLERLLQYVPQRRISAAEACSHPFFDPLFERLASDFCGENFLEEFHRSTEN